MVHILHPYFPRSEDWRCLPYNHNLYPQGCHHCHRDFDQVPWRRWGNDRGKKTEESNRKRESKIPLLWYFCHHHRWSIRLNSSCLTEEEMMTRESKRERKGGRKGTFVSMLTDVETQGDISQKNLPGIFDIRNVTSAFHRLTANSTSHPPPPSTLLPFPDHLFLSKGSNFVFGYIFSICLSRKRITLCLSLSLYVQPCLPDICLLIQ